MVVAANQFTRLSQIIVTSDLKTVTKDVTAHVARNALARESRYSDRNFRSYSQDAVTIQSENVEIVHEFRMARQQPLDLSATLVEVNVSSLWTLMTDYNAIILKTGTWNTSTSTAAIQGCDNCVYNLARTTNDGAADEDGFGQDDRGCTTFLRSLPHSFSDVYPQEDH